MRIGSFNTKAMSSASQIHLSRCHCANAFVTSCNICVSYVLFLVIVIVEHWRLWEGCATTKRMCSISGKS